jgi:glutaryl-CoA transferase
LWARFCRALDRPDWENDPRFNTNTARVRNRAELKHEIEQCFVGRTVVELGRQLELHGVPWGRVRDARAAIEHPQVAARHLLVRQTHATLGSIQALAPVVKLSRTPLAPQLPPPLLGEHTAEIVPTFTHGQYMVR